MISTTQPTIPAPTRAHATEGLKGGAKIEPSPYFRWSYLIGQACALVLLVPAAPVLLALVALVRLTSPGPAIYRQVRVGRHGKPFTIYKIRTMRNDAEKNTGPTWAKVNDARLTGIGKFIRSIHLDELPQLLNVVKGDMALVGPRPERPEFTHQLAIEVEGYLDRLSVRPGVTGLAQINLPPDTDLDSVRRKFVLDMEYIRIASAWLDFRMMCWTALRLLGLRDSITAVFRLNRTVKLPAPVAECDAAANGDEVRSNNVPPAPFAWNGHATTVDGRENGRAEAVRPR